jgi:mRNA interferase HigB
MQVIARRTLKKFWTRHPHAQGPIRAWHAIAAKAHWANPAEIGRQFGGTVDFVGDNRVIFISAATNIGWSSTYHIRSAVCW